jgi:hypothetical protein
MTLILIVVGVLLACVFLQGLAIMLPILLVVAGINWLSSTVTEHPLVVPTLVVLGLVVLYGIAKEHEARNKT